MNLADEILAQVKTLLRGERLTPRQRQILAELTADTAELYVNTASGAWDAKRVARNKAQLDAQVLGLKSIGAAKAAKVYWRAVNLAIAALGKAILLA